MPVHTADLHPNTFIHSRLLDPLLSVSYIILIAPKFWNSKPKRLCDLYTVSDEDLFESEFQFRVYGVPLTVKLLLIRFSMTLLLACSPFSVIYISINLFSRPSIHPSIHLFIHPSILPPFHPFIHCSFHPSIDHPSIHLFFLVHFTSLPFTVNNRTHAHSYTLIHYRQFNV